MPQIYKYVFRCAYPGHREKFEIPGFKRILTTQMQRNNCCFWVELDNFKPYKTIEFVTFGTGQDLPEDFDTFQYAGTVQEDDYVWHVYYREIA